MVRKAGKRHPNARELGATMVETALLISLIAVTLISGLNQVSAAMGKTLCTTARVAGGSAIYNPADPCSEQPPPPDP